MANKQTEVIENIEQETKVEVNSSRQLFNEAFDEIFKYIKLPSNIQKAIKGTTLIRGGTSIFVGLPGTAKTTIIEMMAKVFGGKMAKITAAPQKVTLEGSFYRLDIPALMRGEEKIVWKEITDADFLFISEINRAPQSFQDELIDLLQYRELESYGQIKKMKDNALGFLDMNWYRGTIDKAIGDRPRTLISFPKADAMNRMQLSQQRFNKRSLTDLRKLVTKKADLDDLYACQTEVEAIELDPTALLIATLITESFSACIYNRDFASERWIPPCFEDQLNKLGEVDTNIKPKCSFLGEICSCVKAPMAYRLDESLILLAKSFAWLEGSTKVSQDNITDALKYVVGNRLELRDSIAKHWVNASVWVEKELTSYLNAKKLKQWGKAIDCYITILKKDRTATEIERAKDQLEAFAKKNVELRPFAYAVGIAEFEDEDLQKKKLDDDND